MAAAISEHVGQGTARMPAWLAEDPDSEDDLPWPTVEELLEDLEVLKAAAARAASQAAEVWQLDDRELLGEVAAAFRAMTSAHARWLALLAEAERRQATVHEHSLPAASWLAAGTTHSARTARADVRLAVMVQGCPAVAGALAAGSLSVEQAAAIVHGLDRLPDDLDSTQVDAVAAHLVDLAAEFNPTALRRLVNHAVEVVAPDVVEQHTGDALARAERAQHANRHLAWKTDPDDGSLRFWGKLPAADGELLRQHLSALATGLRLADAQAGVDTTHGQALASALALVVGHHATCQGGPAKGGDHTRVIVTLTLDQLRTGLGAAGLVESDTLLSAGHARQLACTAGIIPLVLNGDSVPLDLGRTQRLFTPSQRLALAVRDGGCAFPGCDRPPSDCEAHHATTPWQSGGLTNLADGVLLCPHHHHLVEPDPTKPPDAHWQITFDTHRRAVFHSPADRNGRRTTRQHHRYRT